MDELQRILNRGNSHFITEMKTRWGDFYAKAQFYGVFKKVMRPQLLDKGEWLDIIANEGHLSFDLSSINKG